jgi:putative ABC transport system substrate-binding protein
MALWSLLVALLWVVAAPLVADAQPAGKVWRVAVASSTAYVPPLRSALSDLGYVEGQNLILDQRSAAEGRAERYPATIEQLLALNPDVLVAAGPHAIRAAQRATATVPIVAHDMESDPVASGFIKSFARPGGNITGTFLDLPELAGKQLQFLQELLPG